MRKWAEAGINDTELTTALERQGYTSKESTPEQLWETVYRGRTGIESMSIDRMYDEGRLYQDANGTTPVTGVEQPVGLMLDGSQRLRLGPELVTNGDFSEFVGTTDDGQGDTFTDWNLRNQSGDCRYESVTDSPQGNSKSLRYVHLAPPNYRHHHKIWRSVAIGRGTLYKLEFWCKSDTTTSITVTDDGNSMGSLTKGVSVKSSWEKNIYYFTGHENSEGIHFFLGTNGTKHITGVSLKEILGNHPHQPTDMNRPVLSSRVNGLKHTEDLGGAGWAVFDGASVTGTNVVNLPGNQSRIVYAWATNAPIGATAKGSIILSGTGTVTIKVQRRFTDGGTYEATSRVIDLTSTPTRYDVEHTIQYENQSGFIFAIIKMSSDTVTQVTATKADLRYTNDGVDLPAYQRVGDVDAIPGDYDSQNFPMYLAFNGTNQYLKVTGMQPKVDEVFVSAAVRVHDSATAKIVVELSENSNSNDCSFRLTSGSSANHKYYFRSVGTAPAGDTSSKQYPAPISNIVTGLAQISNDYCALRVDGMHDEKSANDQGSGNYGNHDLYIGSRAGTALFYDGRLYGLALVFDNPPDDVIATIEHTLNRNAKIHA